MLQSRDRPIWLFGVDADISAIHGPIAGISKIRKSSFLLHYQKYWCILCLTFFSKTSKIRISELKIFKL